MFFLFSLVPELRCSSTAQAGGGEEQEAEAAVCLAGCAWGKLPAAGPVPQVHKSSLSKAESTSEVARSIKYTRISTGICKNTLLQRF